MRVLYGMKVAQKLGKSMADGQARCPLYLTLSELRMSEDSKVVKRIIIKKMQQALHCQSSVGNEAM